MDINIAIGLSVTAYARIIMSEFFNNPGLTGKIYYSDTDSIFCEKELPDSYIGKALGKMKLEHVLSRFIAIAPKVYGGIDLDGKEFTKVKGFKDKLTFNDLEELLKERSIKFHNKKWYRDKKSGRITIKELPYTLRPTDNNIFKRFNL